MSERYGWAESVTSPPSPKTRRSDLAHGVGNKSVSTPPDVSRWKAPYTRKPRKQPEPSLFHSDVFLLGGQKPATAEFLGALQTSPIPNFLKCFIPKLGPSKKKSPSRNSSANTEHMSRRASAPSGDKGPVLPGVSRQIYLKWVLNRGHLSLGIPSRLQMTVTGFGESHTQEAGIPPSSLILEMWKGSAGNVAQNEARCKLLIYPG